MNVQIRALMLDDVSRVEEIDRQAFPTLWPPTSLKRELENRLAKYLIAWEPKPPLRQDGAYPMEGHVLTEAASLSDGPFLRRLAGSVKRRFPFTKPPRVESPRREGLDYAILGFVGLWFMAGEAHITAIAVEEASRGKGIGELLLMGSIELAMSRGATVVSLEARVSNYVAQSLYQKYGFQKVGIRKGYYTDNREDAVIMTTQPIKNPAYQEKFQALKEAYRQRYGEIKITLA